MVADIAGAFLNADMDDFVIMKFKGDMVDYVVQSNPEKYKDFVTYEGGQKVLYVRLLNAKCALWMYAERHAMVQDVRKHSPRSWVQTEPV